MIFTIYAIVLLIFVVLATILVYHMFRYNIRGNMHILAASVFILVSLLIIVATIISIIAA